MEIQIPYRFQFRNYQIPLVRAMDSGIKRAQVFWHRRAGKDLCMFNYLIKRAVVTPGVHYYFFPTYAQGKKALWDNITMDGHKMVDYFIPPELLKSKNGTDMKLVIKAGEGCQHESVIQVIGTDNYDSIRGTNPVGSVFSEFAYQDPRAWDVVRPIVALNPNAWVIFNSTPQGKNHAFKQFEAVKDKPHWFTQILTIADTKVVGEDILEEERTMGVEEEVIQREYYCSFEGGVLGAYYSANVKELKDQNRLCVIPIEKAVKVDLFLDLGRSDATAIIFMQRIGKEIRIIDHEEHSGLDIADYANIINDKGYRIGTMYLPHDAFSRRLESPHTIAEQFEKLGFKVEKVPELSINQGIQLVRKIFPQLWINKDTTLRLMEAIEAYQKDFDEKRKVFKSYPRHDWTSHSADALRYMAIIIESIQHQEEKSSASGGMQNYIDNLRRSQEHDRLQSL